jgi:D-sedoheptulose 7-phosphate isomerase
MAYSIREHLLATSESLTRMAEQTAQAEEAAQQLVKALRNGKKLVVFGNGGSAADAQHFAAELVGRFEKARPGLPAIALTTDTSAITAIANDFSYDEVFARQVQAIVQTGDVVVGISTSGNSRSILLGIEEAKKKKAYTIALSGGTGGKLKPVADLCILALSPRTAHIQETHIALIHAICACVDDAFVTVSA